MRWLQGGSLTEHVPHPQSAGGSMSLGEVMVTEACFCPFRTMGRMRPHQVLGFPGMPNLPGFPGSVIPTGAGGWGCAGGKPWSQVTKDLPCPDIWALWSQGPPLALCPDQAVH